MSERTPNRLRASVEEASLSPGYRHIIDRLLDRLPDDEAADVLDLLTGEPWVSHAAAARVLAKHYPDLPSPETLAERIGAWRRRGGLRQP